MSNDEYFNYIYHNIKKLPNQLQEELEECLSNLEEQGDLKIRQIKKYIKTNCWNILYKTFRIRDIKKLAHICKYILEIEWYNEWLVSVTGKHTRTIFGWFD